MENSLGVGDPQTVFLFRVSPVKTPIGEEWMSEFFKNLRTPRGPFQRTMLPYVVR